MVNWPNEIIEFASSLTPAEYRAICHHADGCASKLSWQVIKRFRAEMERIRNEKGNGLNTACTAGKLTELHTACTGECKYDLLREGA